MNKFINLINLTFEGMNCEQLDILQAAVRLAGDNFSVLYEKGILSEDYVSAYRDFFKELGNKLTDVQVFILEHSFCTNFNLSIDFRQLSVGGLLDCDPVDDPDFLKGGDKECE